MGWKDTVKQTGEGCGEGIRRERMVGGREREGGKGEGEERKRSKEGEVRKRKDTKDVECNLIIVYFCCDKLIH